MANRTPPVIHEWYEGVPRGIGKQTLFGVLLVAAGFGGFGFWSATAPLAAAVIASGSFVATGQNQIVQHLEGGLIRELLVGEGDQVRSGQDLLALDETAARSTARQLMLRQLRLEATLARLHAESRGSETYAPPVSVLKQMSDFEVRSIHESQRENFEAGRLKLATQISLLNQNIAALEFRKGGREAQLAALERQSVLLGDELARKTILLGKELIARSEVNVLDRAVADADGDAARLRAEIAEVGAQIQGYEKEIVQARDEVKQTALDAVQTVEAELDGVREQMHAADNVLGRTMIKAPVAGTIVRMHYHTPGGVIESGKAILEILPTDVPLIIEAQVPRMQIDEVRKGQSATVRLTALNQRTTPILVGEVVYVSADAIEDPHAVLDKEVYLARISVPASELRRVNGFAPTPGMPAEILIQTASRTFIEYLSKPIADSMARAFHEH